MTLQNTVYTEQALGREGFIARNNPVVSLPMVAESDVVAGKFAFYGTDPEKQVIGASASTSSKTAVDGLIVYNWMQVNMAGSPSLDINNGEEVRLVFKGFAYVRPTTASVKGYKVCMDPATGEIQTASSVPSGFIDTGWTVETGASANQVCEIKNI